MSDLTISDVSGFQSTLPHGERRGAWVGHGPVVEISIHAPAWGATVCFTSIGVMLGFQSTLPHGERLNWTSITTTVNIFQSTLPHGERRPIPSTMRAFRCISIHAPAWGATSALGQLSAYVRISIHAPAWGATARRAGWRIVRLISIHAPAWGATPRKPPRPIQLKHISIHAPAWGATHNGTRATPASPNFNPRSRMGSDATSHFLRDMTGYFNPRSRMGSDRYTKVRYIMPIHISIHAPAWGATRALVVQLCSRTFQSTLPHGERPAPADAGLMVDLISIHAPAWGATFLLR